MQFQQQILGDADSNITLCYIRAKPNSDWYYRSKKFTSCTNIILASHSIIQTWTSQVLNYKLLPYEMMQIDEKKKKKYNDEKSKSS